MLSEAPGELVPSTEPVLCHEFIPVSAQHRNGHRPVLLLSSLPAASSHFWNSDPCCLCVIEVLKKQSFPAVLLSLFFRPVYLSLGWGGSQNKLVAIMLAYLLIICV